MERYIVSISTHAFTEDFLVYAFNFGDALEKGINEFKKKYTRFCYTYRIVLRRKEEEFAEYVKV